MTFDLVVEGFRGRFPKHGSFTLMRGERLIHAVRGAKVPNEPGVYLISDGHTVESKLLYIGKAGTFNGDGSWKAQGLSRRLTMKQDGMYRWQFFSKLMERDELTALKFEWFVTYDGELKILPILAEAQLLQAYHDSYGLLPSLNRCA